jgi:hypothetical protein
MAGLALAAVMLVSGCGDSKLAAGATPLQTAENLCATLAAGDYAKGATAFDFDALARSLNDNWDDLPSGQRHLIIESVKREKAEEIAEWTAKLGGPPTASEGGQAGYVLLTGASKVCTLRMADVEGKWLIQQEWW